MKEQIKLHLGCGKRYFPGWVHIDGGDYEHLDYQDITELPYENNTVDLIYASHVLEYFDRVEALSVLNEWYCVLKPGGVLRLAVPDFGKMVHLYEKGSYKLESFLGPLYGRMGMGDKTIYHKTVYDEQSLVTLLKQVGFKEYKRWDWKQTDHAEFDDHSQAYLPHMDKKHGTLISLNLEFIK